jgi:hypothetical protein
MDIEAFHALLREHLSCGPLYPIHRLGNFNLIDTMPKILNDFFQSSEADIEQRFPSEHGGRAGLPEDNVV